MADETVLIPEAKVVIIQNLLTKYKAFHLAKIDEQLANPNTTAGDAARLQSQRTALENLGWKKFVWNYFLVGVSQMRGQMANENMRVRQQVAEREEQTEAMNDLAGLE